MSYMRLLLVCWFIFVISIYHAWGQDPLPIMELYAPDVNSITKTSGCKVGLLNDVDFFTVRGKVNRNGANSDAYKDTNLYLQAVAHPSTNSWKSQCRPDLTVCGSNLNTDCYCERNDANGDYHIVMTIIAKSIYSGGKLMLSWNDARSPNNTPIVSNQVNYYPGIICDPSPIMELYAPDMNNVTKISGSKAGLINDVDFFTVKGKVNKNGANADAYKDTNLYLQAVKDPSTNAWASQCRPDLTVCGSNLTADCYCERKDENGDYHIVMTIMAKSIYSGGKLMLSWNDGRSPFNPPVLSNQVDYYPGIICDQVILTLKIESTELPLVTGQGANPDIFNNVTSAQLCLENLAGISSFEIEENGNPLAQTTTDSCLTFNLTDKSPNAVWTVSYTESGGCERTGSYTIYLKVVLDCGLGAYQIALFVIDCWYWVALVVILIIILYQKYINRSFCGLKAFWIDSIVNAVLWLVDVVILILLICHKKFDKPECGFEVYEIALIVVTCVLTVIGVILAVVLYFKYRNNQVLEFGNYEIAAMVMMCICTGIGLILVLVFFLVCNKRKNNENSGSSSEPEEREPEDNVIRVPEEREREIVKVIKVPKEGNGSHIELRFVKNSTAPDDSNITD